MEIWVCIFVHVLKHEHVIVDIGVSFSSYMDIFYFLSRIMGLSFGPYMDLSLYIFHIRQMGVSFMGVSLSYYI